MRRSETVPYRAGDGFQCNLVHWFDPSVKATEGPIILVQGAGVRANTFNPPNPVNLVQMLVDSGFDVWVNNWRASIDLEFNQYDLDIAAVHDHPAAVRTVLEETGHTELNAIIHCQGSTSFTISLVNGLVPQVRGVVSNAVSLHPIVPTWSRVKMGVMLPVLSRVLPCMDAQWARSASGFWPRMVNAMAQISHREKDTPVGKFTSLMFGSGFPAMWSLDNLTPETLEWIQDEFGKVPMSFFAHIRKSIRAGELVNNGTVPGLPPRHGSFTPKTDARFSFFTGRNNRTFLSASQQRSFEYFDRLRPGFHSLHVLEGYSHLDVFYGKDAHKNVFPLMIQELGKTPVRAPGAVNARS